MLSHLENGDKLKFDIGKLVQQHELHFFTALFVSFKVASIGVSKFGMGIQILN